MRHHPSFAAVAVAAAAAALTLSPAIATSTGGPHSSGPAPGRVLFTTPQPQDWQMTDDVQALTVPGATPAAPWHAVYYVTGGQFTIVNATGHTRTFTDKDCDNCVFHGWTVPGPDAFCYLSSSTMGCVNVTDGSSPWRRTFTYVAKEYTGVTSAGIWMFVSDASDDFTLHLRVYSFAEHLNMVLDYAPPSAVVGACDASGWCVTLDLDQGIGCAIRWGSDSCQWTKNGIATRGSKFAFVESVSGNRTVLISDGTRIEARDLATGNHRYTINYEGVANGPSLGDTTGSQLVPCGPYFVAMKTKVALIPIDAPQNAAVSTVAVGTAVLNSVTCNATAVLVSVAPNTERVPVLYAFDTSEPTPSLRATWSLQGTFQSPCGATGLLGLICDQVSVHAVDLFANPTAGIPHYPWLARAGGAASMGGGARAPAVLPYRPPSTDTHVVVFPAGGSNNNYALVGVRVSGTDRAFLRNEKFAAIAYDAPSGCVYATVNENDGLTRVSVPSMQLVYDTAVVAGDSDANDGSSGSGAIGPAFAGQTAEPPLFVTLTAGERLVIAVAQYTIDGEATSCFNTYAANTGELAFRYCMATSDTVQDYVGTMTTVQGTSVFSISQNALYGVSAETGKELWPAVQIGTGGEVQPYGIAMSLDGRFILVSINNMDSGAASILAVGVHDGNTWWQTTLSSNYVQLVFAPVVDGEHAIACYTGNGYQCARVVVKTGAIVPGEGGVTMWGATHRNPQLANGRTFLGVGSPQPGVAEIDWANQTAGVVIAVKLSTPDLPDVQILGVRNGTTAGSLEFALAFIDDTSGDTIGAGVYELNATGAQRTLWTVGPNLHLGQGTCLVQSSGLAFPDAGLVTIVCGGFTAVFDWATGARHGVYPADDSGASLVQLGVVTSSGSALFSAVDGALAAYPGLLPPPPTTAPPVTSTPAPPPTTTTHALTHPPSTTTTHAPTQPPTTTTTHAPNATTTTPSSTTSTTAAPVQTTQTPQQAPATTTSMAKPTTPPPTTTNSSTTAAVATTRAPRPTEAPNATGHHGNASHASPGPVAYAPHHPSTMVVGAIIGAFVLVCVIAGVGYWASQKSDGCIVFFSSRKGHGTARSAAESSLLDWRTDTADRGHRPDGDHAHEDDPLVYPGLETGSTDELGLGLAGPDSQSTIVIEHSAAPSVVNCLLAPPPATMMTTKPTMKPKGTVKLLTK